ncbi:MAG TPA: hypothetical protein VEB59_00265 [Gemmatimonadales bacterium]|nr:hypothetical protein [Gemmatimonadales bacterium]
MRNAVVGLALLGAVALAACQDNASPTAEPLATNPALAKAKAQPALKGTPTERAAQIAARVNARLEASGSTKRLDEVWMFTVGQGTDPYRRLRTGPRWSHPRSLTYMIDQDYTTDVPAAQVHAAIAASFERHDAVPGISLNLTELPYNGGNNDVLDGVILNTAGECVDIVDLDSDILNSYDPATGALDFDIITDNYFGGWYEPIYFENCLGSPDIIGVTWTFSDVDGALGEGTDGYRDRIYTEQYYNNGFDWVDGGSPFLSDLMDIQSIVTHEAGHAMGLGHFGGPNHYPGGQPFKLQPNGRVFDPEAVMNPFYLGGDKRELYPTDIAGLKALYASKTK